MYLTKWTTILLLSLCLCLAGNAQDFSNSELLVRSVTDPNALEWVDLDGDGLDDLILASDQGVDYVDGNINNKLGTIINIDSELKEVRCLKVGQLDADPKPDLVAGTESGLYYLMNFTPNSNTKFTKLSSHSDTIQSLVLADINGDGTLDIVAGEYHNWRLVAYLNNGGVISNSQSIAWGYHKGIIKIRANDFDQDGDIDLAVIKKSSEEAHVYLNDSNGFYSNKILIASGSYQYKISDLDFEDLNNDGFPDLALSVYNHQRVRIWHNNTMGGIVEKDSIQTTLTNISNVHITDFNNDGFSDLAIFEPEEIVSIYLNDSTGNFNNSSYSSTGSSIITTVGKQRGITINDRDSNGYPEIYRTNINGRIFSFQTDSNSTVVTKETTLNLLPFVLTFDFIDFENDGQDELIIGTRDGVFIYDYDNTKQQYVVNTKLFASIKRWSRIAFGDVTGDSLKDIILTSSTSDSIYFSKNLGNKNFSTPTRFDKAPFWGITLIDLNGDDIKEVVYRDGSYSLVSVQYNQNGYFNNTTIIDPAPTASNGYYLVDIDSDGVTDIFKSPSYNQGVYYKNNGTLSMQKNNLLGPFFDLSMISTINYDNDGHNDLIAYNHLTSDLVVFPNIISNPSNSIIINSYGGYNPFGGLLKTYNDLNFDGFDDIVVSPQGYIRPSIYTSEPGSTYSKTEVLSSGEYILRLNFHDVDKDGDVDVVIGNSNGIKLIGNRYFSPYRLKSFVWEDSNNNKVFDNNEFPVPFFKLLVNSSLAFYTDTNGVANTSVDSGLVKVSVPVLKHWQITTDSASFTNIFQGNTDTAHVAFGIRPLNTIADYHVDAVMSSTRCNEPATIWFSVTNIGTIANAGMVKIEIDSTIVMDSIFYNQVDSTFGNTHFVYVDTLNYFQDWKLETSCIMPNFGLIGDTVSVKISFSVDSANAFSLVNSQIILCSYDPNDKLVLPKGEGVSGNISVDTDSLVYTIRFQNTGNSFAKHVILRDKLSGFLDHSSLQILSSSHNPVLEIDSAGMAKFSFLNIYLPDSATSQQESKGYVKFRIDIDSSAIPGTRISNYADIYFDANPPITTDTVYSTLSCDFITRPKLVQVGDTIKANTQFDNGIQEWYYNGNPISNAVDYCIGNLIGDYYTSFLLQNGCLVFSDTIVLNCALTPVPSLQQSADTIILQNPTDSTVWYRNGQQITAGDTSIIVNSIGTYYASVYHSNGCLLWSDSLTIACNNNIKPTLSFVNDTLKLVGLGDSTIWYNSGTIVGTNTTTFYPDSVGIYYGQSYYKYGCFLYSDTIELSCNNYPNPVLVNQNDTLLAVNWTASNSHWFRNDTLINHQQNTLFPPKNGNYYYLNNYTAFCALKSNKVPFNSFSVDEPMATSATVIYPNPTDGILYLELENVNKNSVKITLTDTKGKTIFKTESIEEKCQLDISHFANGPYFLKIIAEESETVHLIVIQH